MSSPPINHPRCRLGNQPITPVEASEVLASDLFGAFTRTQRAATAARWVASRDEAMVVEHLVGMGRRGASERMAHFFLDLAARLRLAGLEDNSGCACPLWQYHLADVLGLGAEIGHQRRPLLGKGTTTSARQGPFK